jgi:YD repeat-containing protein
MLKCRLKQWTCRSALAIILISAGVSAQTLPPPIVENVTPEGFDVSAGRAKPYSLYNFIGPVSRTEAHITTGRSDDGSYLPLIWTIRGPNQVSWRTFTDLHYSHRLNLISEASATNSTISINFFGQGSSFDRILGNVFKDRYKRGSWISVSDSDVIQKYYSSNGTLIDFTNSVSDYYLQSLRPNEIAFSNGSKTHYTYENAGNVNGISTGPSAQRIKRVVNSYGYGFRFYYLDPTVGGLFQGPSGGNTFGQLRRYAITKVESIFTNCISTGVGCFDSVFNAVSYGYTNNSVNYTLTFDSITDNIGNTRLYTENGTTGAKTITDPGTSSPKYTYQGASGAAFNATSSSSFNGPAGTTIFSQTGEYLYPNNLAPCCGYDPLRGTTTKTDAAGATTTYVTEEVLPVPNALPAPLLKSVTDTLGSKISYDYDIYGRTTKVTYPEGNYVSVVYDDRGNVTQRRTVAKPGSGLADIVETASFPANCDELNYRICNKPTASTDAKNAQTDYVWSDVHGQILSETKPADNLGVRPQTIYGYTAYTGLGGDQIWLLTSKTDKINTTTNMVSSYIYNAVNKGLSLRELAVTSPGITLRTCYGYDQYGRKLSETSPRANVAVCP